MGEIDEAFIQAAEHRPKATTIEAEDIPLIDLSALVNSSSSSDDLKIESSDIIRKLAAQIGEASEKWGFFQVINHGVPPDCRQRMEQASREFFAQSKEEKNRVKRGEVDPLGYYDVEHTKNVRDWKEVFDMVTFSSTSIPASNEPHDKDVMALVNKWPLYPPSFRETCEEYGRQMEKLAYKLLGLICLSLDLPADRLNSYFKDQTSFLRLNYYPQCPVPELALGVGRHKDSGGLTILAQDDVGGLQIKRKTDGEWILVKPIPNAYIINVGDIIQVWSNDKFESVEHRVMVNSEKGRFSIPFFFNPSHDVLVEPLEELLNKQNPAKYAAYNWGKFMSTRIHSNFKKMDVENLQVYHFKVSE